MKSKPNKSCYLFLIIVLTIIQFCAVFAIAQSSPIETVHGSIWYRERILPPPNAELVISLVDVAKMDAVATVIASKRFEVNAGPPWDFRLQYDSKKIKTKGRYALQAKLEADGKLFFMTSSHIPVFEHDATKGIKIMLTQVPAQKRVPKTDATLSKTYWKVVELNGTAVNLGAGDKELHLILDDTRKQAKGFSGCNNFTGGFEQKKQQITFGPMAATMMACMDNMEQEYQFLQALEKVNHLLISGETLDFYDSDDHVVLRFNAVYL
jgi:putative lipoprotein